MASVILLLSFYLLSGEGLKAQEDAPEITLSPQREAYHYTYKEREHTLGDSLTHLAFIYALSWPLYALTQPDTVVKYGNFRQYGQNFGKLDFDKDEPFWNLIVHPLSGSQLYLFYRANGYSRIDSLGMTFISSTLFEFTVEIYSEPASIQDMYQTPVLGSVIGLGLELMTLPMLNSQNNVLMFFGHLLNPSTLFDFFQVKIKYNPDLNEPIQGLEVSYQF